MTLDVDNVDVLPSHFVLLFFQMEHVFQHLIVVLQLVSPGDVELHEQPQRTGYDAIQATDDKGGGAGLKVEKDRKDHAAEQHRQGEADHPRVSPL